MRVGSLGEFGLIRELVSQLGSRSDVVVGPGDDAAVVRAEDGALLVLTTDTLVERVHFRREQLSPTDIGWKSLAVSLSDIAAMGAAPRWAMVSVTIPPDLDAYWCSMFCQGLNDCAEQYGAAVVGGNVARSATGDIAIDSALVGVVEGERYVLRSGAQAGDVVLVTGATGLAAAGLECLDQGLAAEPFAVPLIQSFSRPAPRLAEGRAAADEPGVTALIDVSDGLISDLGHICESSGVGARIDSTKMILTEELKACAEATRVDPVEIALTGGEDYELVITCRPDVCTEFAERIKAIPIGTVRPGDGVTVVSADGQPIDVKTAGWNHMRVPGQNE